MNAERRFRVGLVGAGYVSEFHVEALRRIPGVELVGVADVPVWCLPGNHDAPALMRATFAGSRGVSVGGVELAGRWCIVLLDSHHPGEHGGRLAPAELDRLRATLSGGLQGPLVLTAARLDEQKGHKFLLEAAAKVPEATFVLAGTGPVIRLDA